MPKLLIVKSVAFLVFSQDINEKRKHVHIEVKKGRHRNIAKFWIEPEIEVVYHGGLSNKEIVKLMKLIKENLSLLKEQLDKFYAGGQIETIKIN